MYHYFVRSFENLRKNKTFALDYEKNTLRKPHVIIQAKHTPL